MSAGAGLVIAVLVALACALWTQPGMAHPVDDDEAAAFARKNPAVASTFGSFKTTQASGFGYTQYLIVGTSENKRTGAEESVVMMIFESGWPMRCFTGQSWDHEGREHARRVNCAPAPAGLGPLPVDPRRNRLIPFNPVWPGLGANTLLFGLFVWLFPWGLLGRVAPIERGQRISLLEFRWLRPRFLASLAVGLGLLLGSTVMYALAPRTCLSRPEISVGLNELPSGHYLMARRHVGTGAVLNAVYVLESPHDDCDGVWDQDDIPPAEGIPDAWAASLMDELDRALEPGHGCFAIGYGWPRTAVSLTHRWEGSGLGAADARFFRGDHAIWLGATEPHVGYPRALPLRPVVSGLVYNTTCYVAATMAVLLGVGLAQRWIRRRHSQCPTCGHFIPGGKGACPECTHQAPPELKRLGSPLRARRVERDSGEPTVPTTFIPGLGPPPGEPEPPDDDEGEGGRRRGAA